MVIKTENSIKIRKITWVGLILNLLLSSFKFTAGVIGCSDAIIADAIHSISDSATDIMVIIGSYFWSKPPDSNHPYGHQRLETFVSVIIGIIIFFTGIGIGINAIIELHNYNFHQPKIIALIAAATSIISKELLYQWIIKTGSKFKSIALTANAWHHRSDAISSIPAFLSTGCAIIFPGMVMIDQIGAAIISLLIIQSAIKIIWPCITELTGSGASMETCEEIRSISKKHPLVIDVVNIRSRLFGGKLYMEIVIIIDGSTSVKKGFKISELVKKMAMDKIPDLLDIVVHIQPYK